MLQKYIGEFINLDLELERDTGYYFDHSNEYDIDAIDQGNKTRFMNHSTTPNLEAKHKFVNGEKRIAFYAIEDIPAQSEVRMHLMCIF